MGSPLGSLMIPTLPPSVSDSERLDFYATLAGNLSDQSSVHVHWHTHRQNPSVCWICDLNILISKILRIETDNTKSSLDMGTELSSEDDSDAEIENDLNHNDEGIPEYDVEMGDREQEQE